MEPPFLVVAWCIAFGPVEGQCITVGYAVDKATLCVTPDTKKQKESGSQPLQRHIPCDLISFHCGSTH